MKLYRIIFIFIIFISCSSSRNFDNFYNQHKNDNNVSSFQVPGYLKNLVKNASPEINTLFKNVNDFKTISFTDCTAAQSEQINQEINKITNNYTDILRKNTETKKVLISAKEKGDRIKELIIHNNSNNNHTILFLKGDFDPNRIKQLSDSNELGNLNLNH